MNKLKEREPVLEWSPEQELADELVTRIRKLRWIGLDDEAQQLLFELKRLPSGRGASSVLAERRCTD